MSKRGPVPAPLDDDLVGYLLGVLDEPARREIEARLNANPDARRQLDRLRQALLPLASGRDDAVPPPGLAERTLAFVSQRREVKLPSAPGMGSGQAQPRGWWRRSDVLAASVLALVLLGAASAWLANSRHRAQIAACQDNLRRFHAALAQYSDQRPDGLFPRVEQQGPHAFAGVYIPVLSGAGVLPSDASITCPAGEKRSPPEPDQVRRLEEWYRTDRARFDREVAKLAGSYGYALGYRDRSGLHGLRRGAGMDRMPIMADCPPFSGKGSGVEGNCRDHGGKGQNVLYVSGAVQFVTTRGVAGDDIYLNADRLIHAGVHESDSVLAASDASP